MRKLSFLLVLLIACSGNRSQTFKKELQLQPFNQSAIQLLPSFDSARQYILEYYDSLNFENGFDDLADNKGPMFNYNHYFNSADPRNLPGTLFQKIAPIFDRIGQGNISRFMLLKDSSIIFVLDDYRDSNNEDLHISEALSWYPYSIPKIESEYPRKDSVLDKHWKMQIKYFYKKPLM